MTSAWIVQQPQTLQHTTEHRPMSSTAYAAPSFGFGQQQTASLPWNKPPVNNRRRRRSDTSEEDEDMRSSPARIFSSANKKVKREIVDSRPPSPSSSRLRSSGEDVDLGKMLATCSKPALLSILNGLIDQNPQLKANVLALMPPPSLESFVSGLADLERKLMQAVPKGSNLRPEYVWGRIRTSLEVYVGENRQYLQVFVPAHAAANSAKPEDALHPSTVFSFLATLTESVKRVEAVLPASQSPVNAFKYTNNANNPLLSTLVPLLVNAWHVHLTQTNAQVNQEGRILSAEVVRGRFSKLDELTSPFSALDVAHYGLAEAQNAHVVRKAMEGVRERMVKEIGWLAGYRAPVASPHLQQPPSTFGFAHQSRAKSTESMEEEL